MNKCRKYDVKMRQARKITAYTKEHLHINKTLTKSQMYINCK